MCACVCVFVCVCVGVWCVRVGGREERAREFADVKEVFLLAVALSVSLVGRSDSARG